MHSAEASWKRERKRVFRKRLRRVLIGASLLALLGFAASRCHADSYSEAVAYALAHNGQVIRTSGTPSMEPLIHGRCWVVVTRLPFSNIETGQVLLYRGSARPNGAQITILHRARVKDRYGWIMRGDNARICASETWQRVTPATLLGQLSAVFPDKP